MRRQLSSLLRPTDARLDRILEIMSVIVSSCRFTSLSKGPSLSFSKGLCKIHKLQIPTVCLYKHDHTRIHRYMYMYITLTL